MATWVEDDLEDIELVWVPFEGSCCVSRAMGERDTEIAIQTLGKNSTLRRNDNEE